VSVEKKVVLKLANVSPVIDKTALVEYGNINKINSTVNNEVYQILETETNRFSLPKLALACTKFIGMLEYWNIGILGSNSE
jgi:hypothetical protein